MATLKYCTTQQFGEALKMIKKVPSALPGNTPSLEEVGTGDGSTSTFYLDQGNVVSGTYTLYYGASATSVNSLTETTHYTLDLTTGEITLTAAGITLLSTNKIFAKYDYFSNGLSDSFINATLERAEKRVDGLTNTSFTDGTATNPSYTSREEYQKSQGSFNRIYYSERKPIINITSTLDGDITSTDTTISLATGDGAKFPTSGKIIIGREIISYTGVSTDDLTGCVRGANNSTAAAHTSGDEVNTTIVEISGDGEGNSPTWQAMQYYTDVAIDEEIGEIGIYGDVIISGTMIDNNLSSKQDIPRRTRITYYHGWDEIPVDITRLTIIVAKRMLMTDNISKSMIEGRDEFRPEMMNADEMEMNQIINHYRVAEMQNT